VNGLVLDASALLAYASGASVEPGAMLALADEDPQQQVWIPALCLGQAQLELTGSPSAAMLDVLVSPDRDVQIAAYDAATSRRVARIAATYGVPLDVAHAIRRPRWRLARPGWTSSTSAKRGSEPAPVDPAGLAGHPAPDPAAGSGTSPK
jgi:hypothetical protein